MSITLTPDIPLGDIVAQNPATAKILSAHGIDFCCGGQRTLTEACAADGVDEDKLLGELNAVPVDPVETDWTTASPAELIENLVTVHHEYLWREMPRISALATKVARVHGANHPELKQVATVYQRLMADLTEHLLTEEQEQFPAIAAGSGWSAEAVRELMGEHDVAGDLLKELRDLTDGFAVPADGCASYRLLYHDLEELEIDLHLHIHKENNILFPALIA